MATHSWSTAILKLSLHSRWFCSPLSGAFSIWSSQKIVSSTRATCLAFSDTRSISSLGWIPFWEIRLLLKLPLAVARLKLLPSCFGFLESEKTTCTWHLLVLHNSTPFVGFSNTGLHHPCLNYSANPVRLGMAPVPWVPVSVSPLFHWLGVRFSLNSWVTILVLHFRFQINPQSFYGFDWNFVCQ